MSPGEPERPAGRWPGTGLHRGFEAALENLVLLLVVALATVVVVGVVFRKAGAALVWYDEVASVLLAWLTYYGAALAALRRAHIGFPRLVRSAPRRLRMFLLVVRESVVIGFFLVAAWAGWQVLGVLGGDSLISLPWVPARLAQSVIPAGAVLFIVAELLAVRRELGGAGATGLSRSGPGDPTREPGGGPE